MIRVLFVCLGNICRSPMAEAVFRHKVTAAGLADAFEIDSAGTGGWHAGEAPHVGTRRTLARHGIDATGLVARQIDRDDLAVFDHILTMDRDNYDAVLRLGAPAERVAPLLTYAAETGYHEVPDPYYDGRFELVYQLVDTACDRLLASLHPEPVS